MSKRIIATATIDINVSGDRVWKALTTPEIIKKYMFGTEVVSEWKEGCPIVWKGQWEGKPYEDKGNVIQIRPKKLLRVTHFSTLTGQYDIAENYHTLTYKLMFENEHTNVSLSQDNNATEKEKEHTKKMWESLLIKLKKVLENN